LGWLSLISRRRRIKRHGVSIVGFGIYFFVGGTFTDAGGDSAADYIAFCDQVSYSLLGSGVNTSVITMSIVRGNLYVGGAFTEAGGVPNTSYIARWDGISRYAVGEGLNNSVRSLIQVGPDLFSGGGFTNAGGNLTADLIARFGAVFSKTFLPLVTTNL
jgi:trimeric autotransporter adhesin